MADTNYNKDELNQSKLKLLLDYDCVSGEFTWRRKAGISREDNIFNTRDAGKIAGSAHKVLGYRFICLQYKKYLAHRLAWLYTYGMWPIQIDHINHNRSDNRIINLRETTQAENLKNQSKRSDNTSGITGVYWRKDRDKWKAAITVNQKQKHLGNFLDFNDAVEARKAAEIKYGFHENHGINV
jgi:hypothetical protein